MQMRSKAESYRQVFVQNGSTLDCFRTQNNAFYELVPVQQLKSKLFAIQQFDERIAVDFSVRAQW
jgi:hypothetical protein